jgi:deoxyribonuclease IV
MVEYRIEEVLGNLTMSDMKKVYPKNFPVVKVDDNPAPSLHGKCSFDNFYFTASDIIKTILRENLWSEEKLLRNERILLLSRDIPKKSKDLYLIYLLNLLKPEFGESSKIETHTAWKHKNLLCGFDFSTPDTIYLIVTTKRWNTVRIETCMHLLTCFSVPQKKYKTNKIKNVGIIFPYQNYIFKHNMGKWCSETFLEKIMDNVEFIKQKEEVPKELLESFQKIEHQIGKHRPRKGKILFDSVKDYPKEDNTNTQIFLGSNITFNHNYAERDMKMVNDLVIKQKMNLFVHTPYCANIGDLTSARLEDMQKQMEISRKIGAKGVVVHLGHGKDKEKCIKSITDHIPEIIKYATLDCRLLLETDSGGSVLDDPFQLVDYISDISKNKEIKDKIGICVDTCHVFAAGYEVLDLIKHIEKKDVFLGLIHFNDSRYGKGSRRDVHRQFGLGVIDVKVMCKVALYANEKKIPIVEE